MPGPADHGNALEAFLLRHTNSLAHPGLALGLDRVGVGRRLLAQRGHRLQNSGEDVGPILALLDHVLPPALAIAVAGGGGEPAERIVPGSWELGVGSWGFFGVIGIGIR